MPKKLKRKHITANAILIRDEKALMVLRHPNKRYYAGLWDVPGGHLKKKETPEAALCREVAEELGITITDYYLFNRYDETDPTSGAFSHHYVYVVTAWEGEPANLAQDEHVELGWFSADEIAARAVTPSTQSELLQLLTKPDPDCKLCNYLTGVAFETNFWKVVINRNQNHLGKCFLVLKRHITDHWQMTTTEWAELPEVGARLKTALTNLFQPDHFNYAFLQNQDPHVHLHVIPRYAEGRIFEGDAFEDGRLGQPYSNSQQLVNDDVFEALREALSGQLNTSEAKSSWG